MKTTTMMCLLAFASLTASAEAAEIEVGDWKLTAPAGWRARQEGGRVILGHDRIPGMLVVWADPSATEASVRAAGAAGIHEDGLALEAKGPVKKYATKKYRAFAVDLAGHGSDRAPLRGRVIGILAPKKGALALLALTGPKGFDALAPRLDALARTARVATTPSASSGTAQLVGALCAYSGNSEIGRTQRVTFDGRGGLTYGSETTGSGSIQGSTGQTGSWGVASGNQYAATSAGRYTVRGDEVTVQIDGDTLRCRVHFRQRDGRITEVKCGEQLWGTSLCD